MARPHHLVATLVIPAALVAALAADTAGAQTPAASAGPRALAAAGALPRSAARELRTAERREAAAQPPQRPAPAQPVRFSLAGGLSQPMGDTGEAANLGFNVTGSAEFRPAGFPFGLRADAQFNRFGLDEDEAPEGSGMVIGGQLNGVFNFPQSQASAFRPYVLGGIGLHRVSVSYADYEEPDPETAVSFDFGGGINFRASTLDTFVEIRYQSVRTDDEPTSFLPIVFGVRF